MKLIDFKPHELVGKSVLYALAFDRGKAASKESTGLDIKIYRTIIVKTTRKDIWIAKSRIVFDYDGNQKLKQSKLKHTMLAYIYLLTPKEESQLIARNKANAKVRAKIDTLDKQITTLKHKQYELRK